MIEPTKPLQLDQPEQHVYEPPHHVADYPTYCDAYWFRERALFDFYGPRVVVMLDRKARTFCIEPRGCTDMDAGDALRIASLLTDAVRWATGEVEKLNTPPARQDAATESETRGGFDRKDVM